MKTLFAVLAASVPAESGSASAVTVLITGAGRGLGLEFARQYAERGATVIATVRDPNKAPELRTLATARGNIALERLDASDDAGIQGLAQRCRGRAIDILINNAGVLGDPDQQALGTFSRSAFAATLDVNAFGPLAVSQALREHVLASRQKKIVALTSGLGSIAIAGAMAHGPYFYRMSKTALNMGMQGLGADLKSQGAIVAVVSPGTAETEMLGRYRSAYGATTVATVSPAQSVAGMIRVIEQLDQAKAAQGINSYDGRILPW
jgi:NAD(P)-dependent dehydrogenase (short-subunit alcohol dehydrogenase family)